ncbi:TonB-dependent receptor [Paremcibacter congregatus]|uniref:TonB-dependent receptor n=1 Tax=Paremcibacter congregatus TaxID=2043170 RepID=UPI0030EDE76B
MALHFLLRMVDLRKGMVRLALISGAMFLSPATGLSAPAPSTVREMKVPFDVPAQSLSSALLMFGEQADVSLVVRKEDTTGLKSHAVKGSYYPNEALRRLLGDNRLGFAYIDSRTITLSPDLYKPSQTPVVEAEGPAPTQEDDPALQAADDIDEVVVTALRRRMNMQKVPVAVTVISPPLIRETRLHTLDDVGTRVPGLTVASFSIGQPTIHVRGVGSNDDGAALDNSIVMFIDDVYIGRITSISMNFFDLERIEIMRGPQGTLYGKNAIGGAINVTSNAPTPQLAGDLEMTLGNFDRRDLRATLSGPLVGKKILGRVAVHKRKRDGWQEALFLPGIRQNDENTWSGRSALQIDFSENTQVALRGDYSRDDFESTGRIPVVGRKEVLLLGPDGQLTGEAILPTDLFERLGGRVDMAINSDQGYTDRTIWGVSSRISHRGRYGELLSITAFRNSDFSWLEDSTGLPTHLVNQKVNSNVVEAHRQFSQELRWISPEGQDLTYIAGLYYLFEHTHRTENFIFPGQRSTTDQNNKTNSFAVFGEGTYALAPDLNIKVGGRLTYERKQMHQQNRANGVQIILVDDFTLDNMGSWTDFSPNFALTWQQTPQVMWYGSVSRGYKSGGFQGAPATRDLAERTIDPESVWNFEVGYKSQWFDDRLRLNVVGFYADYRDLQVVQFKTEGNFGFFKTSNAASARIKGLEVEFTLKPFTGLELFGSYGYLDAKYHKFNDLSGRDFAGNTLRQAPRSSLYLAFHYEHPVRGGRLRLRGDYRYQGESYREPDNSLTIQPAFDLLDASIAYETGDNLWELTLWAKNLLDKEYITHLYVLGGNDYALFGTPRTYGATVTYSF